MRKRSDEDDNSLDSLLDTMFNVVGILVIALVLTQMGAREAIKRISASVDPKLLDEARRKLAAHEERRGELSELLDKDPQAELRRVTEQLAEVQRQIEKAQSEAAARERQRQQQEQDLAALTEEERTLREQLEAALARKAELEALLAEAPSEPSKDPPAKVVHLPNPRPAPDKARPVLLLCRDERLYPLDVDALRAQAQERAAQVIRSQQLDRDPDKGIDPEKFVTAFNARKPSNDYFRVAVFARGVEPWLRLERRQDRGQPALVIMRRNSLFRRGLDSLDPAAHYASFLVWPDSFELYLVARQVADAHGIPAGWAPQTMPGDYETPLGGDLRLGPPPPPPPPAPPAPPPPPPPAEPARPVPSDTVD